MSIDRLLQSHEQFIEEVRNVAIKAIPRTFLEDRAILSELATIHRAAGRILARLQEQATPSKKPAPKPRHLKVVRQPPAAVEVQPIEEVPATYPPLRDQVLARLQESPEWSYTNRGLAELMGRPPAQIRRATLALVKQGKITYNDMHLFAVCTNP